MRRPATFRLGRGTLRDPGPDLRRMPIGLDPGGISVAEGVRAALASAVFLALNQWIGSVPLGIAATGAMITCFCDVGGSVRQRVPMLLSFTVLGGVTWAAFGLLRQGHLAAILPVAAATVFLFSMARVWGLRAQPVGNILIVVLALALDRPLTPAAAFLFLACFVAGGLWACVLTIVIWRIQSDRPAARSLGRVWRQLAGLVGDLRALLAARSAAEADWDAHARSHRRAVRAAIEEARGLLTTSVRSRDLLSGRGAQGLLMLEAADRLFGDLIVLSELLQPSSGTTDVRDGAERLLRRLRPVLLVLGHDPPPEPARIRRSLDRMAAEVPGPAALTMLAGRIADHLGVVLRVRQGLDAPSLRTAIAPPDAGFWRARVWGPLRDEWTWKSAVLRHAVRATIVAVPAIAVTLVWWTPYAHWLAITVVLTMQPFFAATWQRFLERVGGTVLGAVLGGALAFVPQIPLVTAGLLLPLSILGFSVRQVSYGAYVACLTPLIVLVFDLAEPGHSAWTVAGMRTLYTLVGGLTAVAACMLLWPSWEPNRLDRDLRDTLRAYGRLAEAVLAPPDPAQAGAVETARRAAGLANSNLEASLSRALQEPRTSRSADLDRLIAADALLRRIGGAILAIPHDAAAAAGLAGPGRDAWRQWIAATLEAIAERRGVSAGAVPALSGAGSLRRIRLAVDLLAGELRPGPGTASRP